MITSVSPHAGHLSYGKALIITGVNLSGTNAVRFGKRSGVHIRVVSPEEVRVTAPSGSGVVPVSVETSLGGESSITARAWYTYAPAPVVSRVAPAKGNVKGGNTVDLQGPGLVWALEVRFGSHLATRIKVVSGEAISVRVPPGSGKLSVVVIAAGGTSVSSERSIYSY